MQATYCVEYDGGSRVKNSSVSAIRRPHVRASRSTSVGKRYQALLAELGGFPGRQVCTLHLIDDLDRASIRVEFRKCSSLHPIPLVGDFLDTLRRPLQED